MKNWMKLVIVLMCILPMLYVVGSGCGSSSSKTKTPAELVGRWLCSDGWEVFVFPKSGSVLIGEVFDYEIETGTPDVLWIDGMDFVRTSGTPGDNIIGSWHDGDEDEVTFGSDTYSVADDFGVWMEGPYEIYPSAGELILFEYIKVKYGSGTMTITPPAYTGMPAFTVEYTVSGDTLIIDWGGGYEITYTRQP